MIAGLCPRAETEPGDGGDALNGRHATLALGAALLLASWGGTALSQMSRRNE